MVRKQFYVICYDISDNGSRNNAAELLEGYGQRVNFSVFECMLTVKQLHTIRKGLTRIMDANTDTILFYRVCVDCFSKAEQLGKPAPDDNEQVVTD